MIDLWKREWNRDRKAWRKFVYGEVLCAVVVCLAFVLMRRKLDAFVAYTLKLPAAVYAFWGIHSGVSIGKAAFYVQWILMSLQVVIAWRGCTGMIDSVWMEEEQGSIFFLCNQWYSRRQIILAKYSWNVINCTVNYSIFLFVSAILAGKGWERAQLGVMFLKGVLVLTMLLALTCCYAVISSRKEDSHWTDILLFGSLGLGNLYKVRDLIIFLLQRANRGYAGFYRVSGWLEGLRWLSPLSWLNPFAGYDGKRTILQVVISLVVIAAASAVAVAGYRVRRFE